MNRFQVLIGGSVLLGTALTALAYLALVYFGVAGTLDEAITRTAFSVCGRGPLAGVADDMCDPVMWWATLGGLVIGVLSVGIGSCAVYWQRGHPQIDAQIAKFERDRRT